MSGVGGVPVLTDERWRATVNVTTAGGRVVNSALRAGDYLTPKRFAELREAIARLAAALEDESRAWLTDSPRGEV